MPMNKSANAINGNGKAPHKIGLYVRVSTEEQAENPEGSIRNQEDRLRQMVQLKNLESPFGEIVGLFVDRAKSGKDTNRPELQRLLEAIRRREISLVMVSELSRLSRSIKDFSGIWELMQACGCGFLSLRESFDTTTAAGEMVLYTVANIAQFERRQVAERVSANITARASRGLYNGGVVPVGYRLIPEKKGYLEVDPERAEVVRRAFQLFVEHRNVTAAAKALNVEGLRIPRPKQGGGSRPRLGHFTVSNLHEILRNPAYIGIRRYLAKGERRETKAVWEPIVDKTLFDRTQEIISANHRRYKPETFKKLPYPLTGAVFCGQCGGSLSGKSAHGCTSKVGYYEHSWMTKKNGCALKKAFTCQPFRVNAAVLESMVWADAQEMMANPKIAEEVIASAYAKFKSQKRSDDERKVQGRIADLDSQLEVLAERLAVLPKAISASPIYNQMEKIQAEREEQVQRLEGLKREGYSKELPAELSSYLALLDAFRRIKSMPGAPDIEGKIVRSLVDKILITPEGVDIVYRTGKEHVEGALAKASALLLSLQKAADSKQNYSPENMRVFSSNTLTNGGLNRNRTCNKALGKLRYIHLTMRPSPHCYRNARVFSRGAAQKPETRDNQTPPWPQPAEDMKSWPSRSSSHSAACAARRAIGVSEN